MSGTYLLDDDVGLLPVALRHDLDEALLACDGVQTVGSASFQMRRIGALEGKPRVIVAIRFGGSLLLAR